MKYRDVTYRPMGPWLGERTNRRRRSIFGSATIGSTNKLLVHELTMLGAARAVIELDIDESKLRQDGHLRAGVTGARTPGVILSFESRHGPLRYATDVFDHWHHNLRAIALGLEALRKVDRYGISRRGEQYRGWRALTTGADDEATAERGRALIREAGSVVEALKLTHPDTHPGRGDVDFRSVMMARDGA